MSIPMETNHLQPNLRLPHHRKLSCEEIIDEMEKEQDAAVVRLLREVEKLKAENLQLRKQLYSSSRSNIQCPVVDTEYHYMLPSHRLAHTRRPSHVEGPGFHPIDTSVPTHMVQKKRGSAAGSPNGSVLLMENAEPVDPLHSVPRRWSMCGSGTSPAEAARRWQDYRIR
ncbi:RTS3 (YGR161C) [Zygosaccharomyces parabailii]|uniref:ZYBA0S04-04940g1_1 n=1 Tax=Zygosaccharomyces bailii (strain CLIB 213 / ATCC 58445 / CBS 680 / BCRC 21525 / NBRC 1098 / NCYC 1416 / NRRL Y-2227) TaxID=1333698 RepID=A0A8J2T5E4_ZYGB2|nr:RTS3 (YGR161C) [Zygosaccharomyces parabailii]CDF89465.1 ZYBA0S04-04940g1_1 [Zygosaccharomyces bailii CLIB 213]CDH08429.1 uncharacterized protein ZBAI_00211 [Zygosaccharomyces bailii ISA1307]SJM85918.1 uncharacterized protein ZBIST_2550 [Zygosaccharomyces bailii]